MNAISARISAVMTSLRCPGCGKIVQPVQPATTSPPSGEGKRWSFVWRPPSGEVCPECRFPLGRYARRVKWMRLFYFGVALLTVAFVLYVLRRVVDVPARFSVLQRGAATIGVVAFALSLVGLVVGGRSGGPGAES